MPVTQSSRDIPYDKIRAEIESAIQGGDTSTVQQKFPQWRQSTSNDEEYNISQRQRNLDGQTFLINAINAGQAAIVSYFLGQGLKYSPWVVHAYIRHSSPVNLDVFEVLLKHGLDINADDGREGTVLRFILPLSLFTSSEAYNLSRVAICANQPLLIEYLLTHGADPNIPCMLASEPRSLLKDYRTPNHPRRPLDWAAHCAPVSTIQLLLSHGANLALSNALHAAAGSDNDDAGRVPVMKFLLKLDVNINAIEYAADEEFTRQWGQERAFGTPLHYAARKGMTERVKFLLASGARKDVRDCAGLGTPREWVIEEPEEGEDVHPVVDLL